MAPLHTVLKNDQSSFTLRSVYKQVHSEYKTKYAMDCYTNEIKWLRELQATHIVPRLLMTNDEQQAIVTEYVGEPVCAATLPHDWKAQCDHILTVLYKHNCVESVSPTVYLCRCCNRCTNVVGVHRVCNR